MAATMAAAKAAAVEAATPKRVAAGKSTASATKGVETATGESAANGTWR